MLNIYIYIYENGTDTFLLNSFFCFPFPFYHTVRYIRFNYFYKFSALKTTELEIRFEFSRGLFMDRLRAVSKFSLLEKQLKKKIQTDATVYQNFISYLYEAQHVSDKTPPIIRSLKLH